MTRTRLGRRGPTECWIVRANRPWLYPMDAIVVSTGSVLGNLGEAVREVYPEAGWHSVDLDRVAPDRPVLLPLPASRVEPGAGLSLAVLVTPHEQSEGAPTLKAIASATRAAVIAARRDGARTLGMPLLATGVLGLPPGAVAEVAVPAALHTAVEVSLPNLVFVCLDLDVEGAIRRAWRRESPAVVEPLGAVAPEVSVAYSAVDLAGGVSTDRVDPNRGIPLDRDRLGVAAYVAMLATVIADRRTPLPLSIGVFGEWGAGKSYFMGMLRQRVDELAASGSTTYCGTIEQIGFNAWHYADSNLWASLGDEIFRQLADDGSTPERNRGRLREELAGQLSQRKALEAATEQARIETAALQARIDEAAANRAMCARDLLRALRGSATAHHEVDSLWARLGLDSEAEQGALLAEQLRGTLDEVDALRQSPWDRRGRLALAAAAVILVVAVFGIAVVPAVREWVAAVGAGLFAAVAGAGIAAMGAARSALSKLRELAGRLHTNEANPELVARLRRAEADQRVAEAQLDDVVAQVGELGRQLTELNPGHRLYSFLADRAHGDSYTSNLGLISTIRKDFEQLVELITDWRANPTLEDGTARQPIDRIVLYIDDLDRCGTRQVVDVLQAVHLLLALDLFVVVVGVDPRWLLRSLHRHYVDILQDGDDDGDHADHRATPEDYLEKILNIPMVLPGMPPGALTELLRSMTDEETPAVLVPAVAPEEPPVVAHVPAIEALEFPVEPGSELETQDRPSAPPQPLSDTEIALLAALDPLIGTPREAKRLMNLYRMLRSTRDLSEASAFLGGQADGKPGECQVVVLLLGLLTAHASLLGQILDTPPDPGTGRAGGLMHRPPKQLWSDFVDDLRPRTDGEAWTNPIRGELPANQVRQWTRLHHGMAHVSALVSVTDLAPFQLWAPRVRRFSYALATA
ncbi:KAP family NTPase [Actinophytocola gossypii]|uniref:Macro domain-containing protein n=1 Tax=Actinophytocola gossypii TaxID=2812003 RepID=A0ABT2J6K4_9PSEU|nr:KAP family NTPase [Actinophytocola gossypii]MCT2583234.1 hypothetical protein [Actinophytocola gossypii]